MEFPFSIFPDIFDKNEKSDALKEIFIYIFIGILTNIILYEMNRWYLPWYIYVIASLLSIFLLLYNYIIVNFALKEFFDYWTNIIFEKDWSDFFETLSDFIEYPLSNFILKEESENKIKEMINKIGKGFVLYLISMIILFTLIINLILYSHVYTSTNFIDFLIKFSFLLISINILSIFYSVNKSFMRNDQQNDQLSSPPQIVASALINRFYNLAFNPVNAMKIQINKDNKNRKKISNRKKLFIDYNIFFIIIKEIAPYFYIIFPNIKNKLKIKPIVYEKSIDYLNKFNCISAKSIIEVYLERKFNIIPIIDIDNIKEINSYILPNEVSEYFKNISSALISLANSLGKNNNKDVNDNKIVTDKIKERLNINRAFMAVYLLEYKNKNSEDKDKNNEKTEKENNNSDKKEEIAARGFLFAIKRTATRSVLRDIRQSYPIAKIEECILMFQLFVKEEYYDEVAKEIYSI